MTCEPVAWRWPGAPPPWGGRATTAALERANEALASALRGLVAADDVAWISPAAARYRGVLAEGTDRVRAARARLGDALAAAAAHDAAVELARETSRRELAAQVLGGVLGGVW